MTYGPQWTPPPPPVPPPNRSAGKWIWLGVGTVSTSANALEQIEVRGDVIEWDGAAHTSESIRFDFPDPFIALMTDGTGIVRGSDLKTGTNSMAIHRTGNDREGSSLDFTLLVSYFAE